MDRSTQPETSARWRSVAGKHDLRPSVGSAVFILLLFVCYAAAAFAIYVAARGGSQDSDTIEPLLTAPAILHGNFLLAGWHLASDNFFFTGLLPVAFAEWLLGPRTAIIGAFPAATYALIVAVALAASIRSFKLSRDNIVSLAVVILLIGLPPTGDPPPWLRAQQHAGTLLFSLVALMLLAGIARPARVRGRTAMGVAFVLLTCLAVASDPFAVAFAFAPAFLVLLAEFLLGRAPWRAVGLLSLVFGSSVFGIFVTRAIAHAGGFVVMPSLLPGFVDASALGGTIAAVFFGFLWTSGAYVFGKDALAAGTIAAAARLIGWILGGIATLYRIPTLRHGGLSNFFDRTLYTSVAIMIAASILSKMFEVGLHNAAEVFTGGATSRYLAPVVVFGAIAAARALPKMIDAFPTRRLRVATTLLVAGLAGGLLVAHTAHASRRMASPPWVSTNQFAAVGRWLEARGLTCGVGGYWSSSIVTALTQGRVTVRAILSLGPDAPAQPYVWLVDENWYRGKEVPTFAIWQQKQAETFHIDRKTVTRAFGAPTRIEHVAGFTIAILPPPISSHPLLLDCTPLTAQNSR